MSDRVDGSVGWPLPSVEVRLVDPDTQAIITQEEAEKPGDIQLRGPTIFGSYWNNPAATRKEFVPADVNDGNQSSWFKTGDVALRRSIPGTGESDQHWAKGPMYFILGRNSVDIIKVGGEKVSALEIERELLALEEIEECAVVGLNDDKWGQKVAAVIVLSEKGRQGKIEDEREGGRKNGKVFGIMDLRRALKGRLAMHKIPVTVKVVQEIRRNAMGKVNKKELVQDLFKEVES
jgi:malonyl-CoA/methylmalonyl-CoA synthetase